MPEAAGGTAAEAILAPVNPSYARLRTPRETAIRRFAAWRGVSAPGSLVETTSDKAVGLACGERGAWKGQAVFVSEIGDWTLFSDLTGGLSATTSASWLKFADGDELVFAAYNDAIGYGAFIRIVGGAIEDDVLFDESTSEVHVRERSAVGPARFRSWIDVAGFVDDDDLAYCDDGLLWIY